jgi:hypothetical protein
MAKRAFPFNSLLNIPVQKDIKHVQYIKNVPVYSVFPYLRSQYYSLNLKQSVVYNHTQLINLQFVYAGSCYAKLMPINICAGSRYYSVSVWGNKQKGVRIFTMDHNQYTLNNQCIFFQLSFSLSVSFLSCFFYSFLLVCQLFFQTFHNKTVSLLLSRVANSFKDFSGGPTKKFGRRRSLKNLHIHENFCL